MPILQSRMTRLIDASHAIIQYARNIARITEETRMSSPLMADAIYLETKADETRDYELLKKAFASSRHAFQALADQVADFKLPFDAVIAISEERAHFAATSRRNEQNAAAMRRLRARRTSDEAEPPRPRITRADYEAFKTGKESLEDQDRRRGFLVDEPEPEPEHESIVANKPLTPEQEAQALDDADALARDQERTRRDAELEREMTEKGVF